jgi:hypothetical protein
MYNRCAQSMRGGQDLHSPGTGGITVTLHEIQTARSPGDQEL